MKMKLSILQSLQSANDNIAWQSGSIGIKIARVQLNNAVILLEKGYPLDQDVNILIEIYLKVENVPEKCILF